MFSLRLLVVFFITLMMMVPQSTLLGQTTGSSQERNTGTSQFGLSLLGNNRIYFVDEFSLELLQPGTFDVSYLDGEIYKIGPNDILSVEIDGATPVTARGLVVNALGSIFIPIAGNVDVTGKTLSEAKLSIEEALTKHIRDFTLQMTLDRPRLARVQITGDVQFPGSFVVMPGKRLDTVLYPALFEQPAPGNVLNAERYHRSFLQSTGLSLRNIKIVRDGEEFRADLISYFRNGDPSENPFIYDGDIITVNRVSDNMPRISVSGAVLNPAEYEYNPNDTLNRLLLLSGGFLQEANTENVIVYRTSGNQTEVININLNDEGAGTFPMLPYDRLVIPHTDNVKRGANAWVYGEAILPGNFPVIEGSTTVADLLDLAGGMTTNSLPHAAYLLRTPSSSRNVQSVNLINTNELMRVSDQLQQGFQYLELESQLQSERRLFIDLNNTENLDRIKLNDGDRLFIPRDYNSIVMYGQLNNPGDYPYNPELSVMDYIRQAGGMSLAAAPERIFVIKAGSRAWLSPGETTLESGDMIFVDREPYDELNAFRSYELQKQTIRQGNIQIILATVSTITAIITTYVAITR